MNDEEKERKGMRRILTSLIHCFIILTAFYTLYYLSYTVFTFYLFIWTADNNYLYLWIIAILLVILKKPFAAYSITAGNIAGVIIGQYLGDYIYAVRSAKITDTMSAEMIHHLSNHHGAFIWLLVVLLSIAAGILLQIRYAKKDGSAMVNIPKSL